MMGAPLIGRQACESSIRCPWAMRAVQAEIGQAGDDFTRPWSSPQLAPMYIISRGGSPTNRCNTPSGIVRHGEALLHRVLFAPPVSR